MSQDILRNILKRQHHPSKGQRVDLETLCPKDYLIIDVRSATLFQSTPHIKDSQNIHDIEELKTFCHQHTKEKILLTCNGGMEAAKYATLLVESGFENIFFLDEYLMIIKDYLPLEGV